MKKILVLVEGQTEETFVNQVLSPDLVSKGIGLVPKILATKITKQGKQYKGGVSTYARAKRDLLRLMRDSSAVLVTTMLDYYALPDDFPGMATRPVSPDPYVRVKHVEDAFASDVSDSRFLPYLSVHELEAILFADLDACSYVFNDNNVLATLKAVRQAFANPEHIDEGPSTAPSKRILAVFDAYQKVVHGAQAGKAIGVQKIREQCPHFDEWLRRLEAA